MALAAILASACATTQRLTAVDTAAVDRLLGLIHERLDVAPQVARAKWNSKAPIEDLPREQQIVDDVSQRAADYGLNPQVVRNFFRAQIDASKLVQHAMHAEWTAKKQPPFPKVADLGADIRPVLDRLTPVMMRALADALPALQQRGGRRLLESQNRAIAGNVPGGDAAFREALAPLLALGR